MPPALVTARVATHTYPTNGSMTADLTQPIMLVLYEELNAPEDIDGARFGHMPS